MSNISLSYLLFLLFLVVLGRNENLDPVTPLAIEEYITGLSESLYMQDAWSHTGHRLSIRFKKKPSTYRFCFLRFLGKSYKINND